MPHPTKDEFLPLFNQKYGVAYIEAVVDGGGNIGNNSDAIPFMLNIDVDFTTGGMNVDRQFDAPNALQSHGDRLLNNNFWIAYVLYAYQPDRAPTPQNRNRADFDPESEDARGAVTPDFDVLLARGSLVFREVERELELAWQQPIEQRGVVHEVAHQFGVPDRENQPGIMGAGFFGPDSAFVFIPEDIVILRKRIKSPGTGPDPRQ
jgi:hypothetical protein